MSAREVALTAHLARVASVPLAEGELVAIVQGRLVMHERVTND